MKCRKLCEKCDRQMLSVVERMFSPPDLSPNIYVPMYSVHASQLPIPFNTSIFRGFCLVEWDYSSTNDGVWKVQANWTFHSFILWSYESKWRRSISIVKSSLTLQSCLRQCYLMVAAGYFSLLFYRYCLASERAETKL